MTTNHLLLIIILGFIFFAYQEHKNKKSLKNEKDNNLLKLQLDETTAQNKLLVKKIKLEQENEIERRKRELARIALLEQRKKELAWRIELLTRLKYIKRLKRIKRRYTNKVNKKILRVRYKKPIKKFILVKK